jgi:formate dehydrogenase maturation protein FdhE
MKEEGWMQCQNCGELHKMEIHSLSEDDLYITTHCPRCRDETKHLWCGKDKEDVYMYYNLNADPRFYNYNTK